MDDSDKSIHNYLLSPEGPVINGKRDTFVLKIQLDEQEKKTQKSKKMKTSAKGKKVC